MIGEIFKYLWIISLAIISILAVVEILKIAVKGPIHKDRKSKIVWVIICIIYLACALVGSGTIILMLLK